MAIVEMPLVLRRGKLIPPRSCEIPSASILGDQRGLSMLVPGKEEIVTKLIDWMEVCMVVPKNVNACWECTVQPFHTEIDFVGLNIHLENIVDFMSASLFWGDIVSENLLTLV